MLIRPSGKIKPKSKTRNECTSSNSNYTTTSDDIWMKNWGYDSQDLFDAAKEAEMSVSDPEEYLVSRSDEDTTLYAPHNEATRTVTLNSEQHAMLDNRDEEDYVTSVEFTECLERGLFCRESPDSQVVVHYHCPCCLKHSESSVAEIEHHYRECVSTMSNQQALFTSVCKHDNYITFQECKTSDSECPARDIKLPVHYHCPCCMIFTQQIIGQVVRHQLTCCKSLGLLQNTQLESPPGLSHHGSENLCTHEVGLIRFRLCFSPYCLESGETGRKLLHFHCTCCNIYTDKQLRSLRKHQRLCCVYSGTENPRVVFVLSTSAAVQQLNTVQASLSRKRSLADPMSVLSGGRRKVCKKARLAEVDSSLFTKCMETSPICTVSERNRTSHFHCPICRVYTSRRLQRVKMHYTKCSQGKGRPKPRGEKLDLQVELVDKLNRIFLVRGSIHGPALPIHVIYRAGPNSNIMHCEHGCKMDKNMYKVKCPHLDACEEYVKSSEDLVESGADPPPLTQINLFYSFDVDMKNAVYVLVQACAELRVPVIRVYYPIVSCSKSVYVYYSVSAVTTPRYISRCGRVLVTFNEQSQTFKCKCGSGGGCVHVFVSQLYHSHFSADKQDCEAGVWRADGDEAEGWRAEGDVRSDDGSYSGEQCAIVLKEHLPML